MQGDSMAKETISITDSMRKGIRKYVKDNKGGVSKLAKLCGVTQPQMSKYANGDTHKMSGLVWNKLQEHIETFINTEDLQEALKRAVDISGVTDYEKELESVLSDIDKFDLPIPTASILDSRQYTILNARRAELQKKIDHRKSFNNAKKSSLYEQLLISFGNLDAYDQARLYLYAEDLRRRGGGLSEETCLFEKYFTKLSEGKQLEVINYVAGVAKAEMTDRMEEQMKIYEERNLKSAEVVAELNERGKIPNRVSEEPPATDA